MLIAMEALMMTTKRSRSASAPTAKILSRHQSAPGILDAVRDQHGDPWVHYGARDRAIWFAIADLISEPTTVFRRLSSVGAICLTPASQAALKRAVEHQQTFRPALVAARPGWLEGFYIHGDGTLTAPRADTREVIVTFDPNPKFTPSGSLQEWQEAAAPFVTDQPLPFFALALALTGPLLRFAPRGYSNPQAEIVGKGETGKTSVGVLAASLWSGNPDSDCGGGELWDMTINALDPVKLAHRDGFVFLDEGNLAGVSVKDRREFARQAVFKIATTGGKRRMGDAVQSEHAHLALLSTTNTALADLLDGPTEARDAAQTRMITIRITPDSPHGIFATVPAGYTTSRAATEAMRAAADRVWGIAGRDFIKHLVLAAERDEELLRRGIARSLKSYIRLDRTPTSSARIQKTFALATVAAALAQRWNILQAEWGNPLDLIQAVACANSVAKIPTGTDTISAIHDYVAEYSNRLIDVTSLPEPLGRDQFEAAIGFLRGSGRTKEVLIPAAQFQSSFPGHEAMMRALRASGQAQTEGGQSPKLTIKTPRTICHEGRVYCIRLGSSAFPAANAM